MGIVIVGYMKAPLEENEGHKIHIHKHKYKHTRRMERGSNGRSGDKRRYAGERRGQRENGGERMGGEGSRMTDPPAPQLERKNDERSQTNQCARVECLGVMSRVQTKLSRIPHAHHGANLLEAPRKQENERR